MAADTKTVEHGRDRASVAVATPRTRRPDGPAESRSAESTGPGNYSDIDREVRRRLTMLGTSWD